MTSHPSERDGFSRREFLEFTGKAALVAAAAQVGPLRAVYADGQGERVSMVFFPNFAPQAPDRAVIRQKLEEAVGAVDGLGWLQPGDSVAINVATNSPKPYPMTTHPEALRAFVEMLQARGAGRVVVADLAGVENVAPQVSLEDDDFNRRLRELYVKATGRILGEGVAESGQDVLERCGIAEAIGPTGAEVRSFDGVDDWIHVGDAGLGWSPETTPNWTPERPSIPGGGFRVPRLVTEVDHLVNFARPSGHVMAGHTGTVKNWYGWLHPLDRLWSHTRIGWRSWGQMRLLDGLTGLKEVKLLHERVAEVAAAFAPKTRLNLVAGIDTYVDIGPDWGVQPLQQSWVMASAGMSAIDAAVTAVVLHEKKRVPRDERRERWEGSRWRFNSEAFWGREEGGMHRFHGTWAFDAQVAEPSAGGAWSARQLEHAAEIGLAADPDQAEYLVGGDPDGDYVDAIHHLTGGERGELGGLSDRLPGGGEGR